MQYDVNKLDFMKKCYTKYKEKKYQYLESIELNTLFGYFNAYDKDKGKVLALNFFESYKTFLSYTSRMN